METITNLEDAKELAIGEHFIFGEYEHKSIEWQIIEENLAISENMLDCIVFNHYTNNNDNESIMREWCNNVLGKALNLSKDTLFVFDKKEITPYFQTPTDWPILHGIYVDENGKRSYWTSSTSSTWYDFSRFVYDSGLFGAPPTGTSRIGVRPALKLD